MGEKNVTKIDSNNDRATFIQHLIQDIEALELMLESGLIENDIVRIGAEQEFCLVNQDWRPAINSDAILKAINDPHFTTELARYNLEINLDPLILKGNCFGQMRLELNALLEKARIEAEKLDTKVILTGILPTISQLELEIEFMTKNERYYALNDMLRSIKGDDFQLHLKGVDELSITHDSVLFEACNTSFQLHLQIPPEDFISSYNWAQAISGPILAIATNSPLLLGRELWSETRIALFQQSIDTRTISYALKSEAPRVKFGKKWESGSVAAIFKDDIAEHKVILSKEIDTSSLTELEAGKVPKLHALNLHNSTIYRWNRPCYGVGGGKAHLRIENRYIPAGPSTQDEMANFALWVGLMVGRPSQYDDMPSVMDFREAKSNFIKASRMGRDAIIRWKGKTFTIENFMKEELLPIAHEGLKKMGVDDKDRLHLLGIIENRMKLQTGSEWIVKNFRSLKDTVKTDKALRLITSAMYEHQTNNLPVHDWPPVDSNRQLHQESYLVGHIMTKELYTVNENDLATLATELMKWNQIHHMPVVNDHGKLTGLLTWTHAQKFPQRNSDKAKLTVSTIMQLETKTVEPETHITDAIRTMKKYEIGCLPVTDKGDLVGIITIKDVIKFDHA